jgi:hypothetical protein
VLAGRFVFTYGTPLVAEPLASLILELVVGASVELLELLLSHPASTKAAKMVMAVSEMMDFISIFLMFGQSVV